MQLSSEGPAKKFQKECLGIFELDGGFSNGKPTYKHQTNERYLHWAPPSLTTPISRWSVSKIIEMKYQIKRQQQQEQLF